MDVKVNISYDFYGPRPDLSGAKIGERRSIVLINKETQEPERLTFKITRNELFPLVGDRWIYGHVDSDDYTAQLELRLRKEPSLLDTAIVYLIAPEVY